MSNRFKRVIGGSLFALGFDPRKLVSSLRFLPTYIVQLTKYIFSGQSEQFSARIFPIMSDKYTEGGTAKGHYFHQDLWAAKKIYTRNPEKHRDVGSRVDGFIAHLLVFRSVEVVDVRPMSSSVPGLNFLMHDMMATNNDAQSVDSLSCLHALEHFGLGRYGDPINLDGWSLGLRNMAAQLRVGGYLYLSVPIAKKQTLEFNAQRIFHPKTIIKFAKQVGLELTDYSIVDDDGKFMPSSDPNNPECSYGCGLFEFRKSLASPI